MHRRRGRRIWVNQTPENFYFDDRFQKSNESLSLTISEFETMRLKHNMKLNQYQAAEKMGISQSTFSRILERAHEKVVEALIGGKNIKVQGDDFDFKFVFKGYGCLDCSHQWEDKSASREKKEVICSKCNSTNVYYLEKEPI